MKLALTLILGVLVQAHAQRAPEMQMQCSNTSVAGADAQLQALATGFNPDNKQDLECRFSWMEQLSNAHDSRAIPVIAKYLDVSNPVLERTAASDSHIFTPIPFRGRYPALIYIVEYRGDALPILVDAIAHEPGLTLKTKNAVAALMMIEAPDPPAGVKLLADQAKKEQRPVSQTLDSAAQFAVDSWQCHLMKQKCLEALTGSPLSVDPR